MPRKSSKEASRTLEDFEPWISKLGYERCVSGQQIFHHTTHKPLPRYENLTHFQRREVLLASELWCKKLSKEPRFRYWEKRLLAKAFKPDGTTLVLLALAAALALILSDDDGDGIPDLLEAIFQSSFVASETQESVK